jgi:hypothetical protein
MVWGEAMSIAVNDVENAALELDPERRARLALRLIDSLDSSKRLSKEEIERLWLEEAEERLRQLESGEVQAVPSDRVFADARKHLK